MKCYIELIPNHPHIKVSEEGIEAEASLDREWFRVERNSNVYWFPKHRVACVRMAEGEDFMESSNRLSVQEEIAKVSVSKSVAKAIADSLPITREALLEAAGEGAKCGAQSHAAGISTPATPNPKPPVPSRKKKGRRR